MGHAESKMISAEMMKNCEISEVMKVPVEDWEREAERRRSEVQVKAKVDHVVAAQLKGTSEAQQAAGGTSVDITELKMDKAALCEAINSLTVEKMELKAQMDHEVAALQERISELQQVAQVVSETNREENEQKLADTWQTIFQLTQEKAELKEAYEQKLSTVRQTVDHIAKEKAELIQAYEQKLVTMKQTDDQLAKERAETQREKYEQKLAATRQTIRQLTQEKAEVKSQMDHEVAALQERISELEQVAQVMPEIHIEEYEQKIVTMREAIDQLVVERTELRAQLDQKVAALPERTLQAEYATPVMPAIYREEYEQKIFTMREAIDQLVVERTELKAQVDQMAAALPERTLQAEYAAPAMPAIHIEEYEQKIFTMREAIDQLVVERTELKAQLDQKVAALPERTLQAEYAAPVMPAIHIEEYEQKIFTMREAIDQLVVERTELKAQVDQMAAALPERTLQAEYAAPVMPAIHIEEYEQKIFTMREAIDQLVVERTELKAQVDQMAAALQERTLQAEYAAPVMPAIHREEYEQKIVTMREAIDQLVVERTELKAQLDQKVAALQERTFQAEYATPVMPAIQIEEYEQKIVTMREAIDQLVVERTEVKSQMDHEVAALQERISELEQVAQVMPEIHREEYEQKIVTTRVAIDQLVVERTEVKSQMDHEVAALQERTLQAEYAAPVMPAEKAKYEQKLAVVPETIDKPVLEKTKIHKAETELAAMSQTIDKLVQERMMIHREEYEQKLVAMWSTIDQLVQERAEIKVQVDHEVAALQETPFDAEEAAWVISPEKAKFEQNLAAVSEMIDKPVLERTEIHKAESDQRVAAMSQTIDRVVHEKMMIHREEYEQKLVATWQTIDQLAKEKAEAKVQMDRKVAALQERTLQAEDAVRVMSALKAEMERKAALLLKRTFEAEKAARVMSEEKAEVDRTKRALKKITLELQQMAQERPVESMELQGKLATMSKKMELLNRQISLKKTTAESVDPVTVGPTASGSHDPSSLQPNRASSEEQTSAQGSSSVSQLQEEVRLSPSGQSLKKKRGKMNLTKKRRNTKRTKRCEEPEDTSDELFLTAELQAALKESIMSLNSDDSSAKIYGLRRIDLIAQHRTEVIIPVLEEVCMVTLREVLKQEDQVSIQALRLLSDLFLLLKRNFDPYLDSIIEMLLKKPTLDEATLLHVTNVVVSCMIQSCSPLCTVEALLNGLSGQSGRDPDQARAVRECIAHHLVEVVEFIGPQLRLCYKQEKLLHVLSTVNNLSEDASEVLRSSSKKTLGILLTQQEGSFLSLTLSPWATPALWSLAAAVLIPYDPKFSPTPCHILELHI